MSYSGRKHEKTNISFLIFDYPHFERNIVSFSVILRNILLDILQSKISSYDGKPLALWVYLFSRKWFYWFTQLKLPCLSCAYCALIAEKYWKNKTKTWHCHHSLGCHGWLRLSAAIILSLLSLFESFPQGIWSVAWTPTRTVEPLAMWLERVGWNSSPACGWSSQLQEDGSAALVCSQTSIFHELLQVSLTFPRTGIVDLRRLLLLPGLPPITTQWVSVLRAWREWKEVPRLRFSLQRVLTTA